MGRLTIRGDHGILMAPGYDFHIDPDDYDLVQEILARLAAYEDTGLEPEQIETLKTGTCLGCSVPELKEGQALHKEWEEAYQQGRLVVLPCKVGDVLYDITCGKVKEKTVVSIAALLSQSVNRITVHASNERGAITEVDMRAIGKTVFLTREEAEKALKGGAGNAVT